MHDDGGLAFPVHGGYEGDDPRNQIIGGGMTLRDYFAAKAMDAMIAGSLADGVFLDRQQCLKLCESSFLMADAMLEARK